MKDISSVDIKNNLKLACSVPGRFEVKSKKFILSGSDFITISGPCRVESKEQLEMVAKMLTASGLRFLRAGAYKPATFPYATPGMEEEGLKIIDAIAEKYNLISVSEVMAISQVEIVTNHIDVLQVGARNMQNYDLLAAVGKSRKPVLLKRHPGASLRDFLGAAEWLLCHGCENLILCERGITAPYTHDENARWLLDIQIVPALKRISKLLIVLDVSHSSGVRDFVPSLSLASIASGADGVMMEIHPDPEKSKSDKDQTISLQKFEQLLPKMRRVAEAVDKLII